MVFLCAHKCGQPGATTDLALPSRSPEPLKLELASSRRMLTPGEQARHQTCFHSHRKPVPRVSLKCKEFFTIFIDSCSSSLLFIPKLAPPDRKSTCGQGLPLQSCEPQPPFLSRPSDPEAHLPYVPYFPPVLKLPSMSGQVNPRLPQDFGGVWSGLSVVRQRMGLVGLVHWHTSVPWVLCKTLCPLDNLESDV